MPTGPRERLARLLNYVEQVVRLDERVVFQLSDYHLPDGTAFAINGLEHRTCPVFALVFATMKDQFGLKWRGSLVRNRPRRPQK